MLPQQISPSANAQTGLAGTERDLDLQHLALVHTNERTGTHVAWQVRGPQ